MRHLRLIPALIVPLGLLAVNVSAAGSHEVSIALGTQQPTVIVDPAHPKTIVVSSNSHTSVGKTFPASYYTSEDGGKSFTEHNAPLASPFTFSADASLAIVAKGTVFLGYLGSTPSYCQGPRANSSVQVTASTDRGHTFRAPTVVDVAPQDSQDDKPYVAAESEAHGLSHVFITWVRYAKTGNEIHLARSTDGGTTFTSQLLYNSHNNDDGPFPVVAPHRYIYDFWPDLGWPKVSGTPGLTLTRTGEIMFAVSSDDGMHFSTPTAVTPSFTVIPSMIEPGDVRAPTFVSAAATSTGHLYVTWAQVSQDAGNGRVTTDIMVTSSNNHGRTWSTPRRINDIRSGDRFMPAVTTLRDGSAAVVWYDRRTSLDTITLYAAHVSFVHGFQVSRNIRVDTGTSPVNDFYESPPPDQNSPAFKCYAPGRLIGDYNGVAVLHGRTLVVTWADTHMQHQGESDLWLTRVTVPALPGKK